MTDAQQPEVVYCSQCGAENVAGRSTCWLCQRPLVIVAELAAPAPMGGQPQFGLSTLLIGLTVVALCLGLLRSSPGLAIFLLIVSVPALVRAYAANRLDVSRGARSRRRRG